VEAAARIARVMAADLVLYNPHEVAEAIRENDLEHRLEPVLRDLRSAFAARVPADVRARQDFVKDALDAMVERHAITLLQRGLGPVPLSVRMGFHLGMALGRLAALVTRIPLALRAVARWRPPAAAAPPASRPGGPARPGLHATRPPAAPRATSPQLRALAAEIAAMDPATVWVVLTRAMHHPDPERRYAAAVLIGHAKSDQAVHALIAALDDPVLEVRRAALRALVAVTGRAVDFDPTAAGPARRRHIAELLDWWRTWYLQRMWSRPG
jgi:hypothetical protein